MVKLVFRKDFKYNGGMVLIWVSVFLVVLFSALVFFWHGQIIPQPFFHLMPEVDQPERGQRIIVIASHPDDETIAGAGYILSALRRGAEVWVVLATDGNKRGLGSRRIKEFHQAGASLGVSRQNRIEWRYVDGSLQEKHLARLGSDLESVVYRIRPHILIAPHPEDTHRDHAVLGQMAQLSAQKHRLILYQYLTHFARFPRPKGEKSRSYLLPPLKLAVNGDWRVFPLSRLNQEIKKEALLSYRSQLVVPVMRELLLGFLKQNELFSVLDYS